MRPRKTGTDQRLADSDVNSAGASNGRAAKTIIARTADFGDRVIRLCLALPHNSVGREIGRQLVRCGMSVGANVEEAQGAESKADFLHMLRIARKECRETRFFLQRVTNAHLIPGPRLESLLDEADQLSRILSAIILRTSEKENGSDGARRRKR